MIYNAKGDGVNLSPFVYFKFSLQEQPSKHTIPTHITPILWLMGSLFEKESITPESNTIFIYGHNLTNNILFEAESSYAKEKIWNSHINTNLMLKITCILMIFSLECKYLS